jgi:hypothetical protein
MHRMITFIPSRKGMLKPKVHHKLLDVAHASYVESLSGLIGCLGLLDRGLGLSFGLLVQTFLEI